MSISTYQIKLPVASSHVARHCLFPPMNSRAAAPTSPFHFSRCIWGSPTFLRSEYLTVDASLTEFGGINEISKLVQFLRPSRHSPGNLAPIFSPCACERRLAL